VYTMCRLLLTSFVCLGLWAASARGRERPIDATGPEWVARWVVEGSRDDDPSTGRRAARQNDNDPFSGLDPQFNNNNNNNNNNRPFGIGQGQWPGEQQQQRPGNRPQGQNQWSNSGNQRPGGQQQQGSGNRPTNPNRPSTNQQNPNRPSSNQQNPVLQTTTAADGEVSESQRDACNTSCRERTTSEFNPVCGSDRVTYQNRRFLTCVANCGIPTEFSYVGACAKTAAATTTLVT